ncbi:MAG: lysophospholipase L1-like esterase [Polyangiales bacterium]|jgi:lysophospholipase L1-like esterase
MFPRRVAQSPTAVMVVAGVAAGLWAAVYGAAAPASADDDPIELAFPVDGPVRRAAPVVPPNAPEGPPPVVARIGPRLLAPPRDGVPGYDIAIEDADGRSMAALHSALRRAERGEGQARLLFYGASHVASDFISGHVREVLQTRFGDAGHGVIVPAHPWRSYRHRGIDLQSSRGRWSATKVRAGVRDVDHFGIAGTYVESSSPGAYGRVSTATRGDIGRTAGLFDLYYLKQPGGGAFDVFIDGQRVETVQSAADERGSGYATYRVEDAPHTFEVRVQGDGPVRLFGVAAEREEPGVIVDTLGINGARARYHLVWEDTMYREHLRRRQADLVVIAYGTNESGDALPIHRYENQLRQVVGRIREVAPGASCLLIGPSDRPIRQGATFVDRPRTAALIESQHRVAVENGCGFFDLVALSGGPLSMVEWAAMTPSYGAGDYVHYTRRGYQRVAEVLLQAMMEGFDSPPAN